MKKGLSPVIATVLLISIALVLALIIFLWAKSFIGEKTQKEGEPVEDACERVEFTAEGVKDDNKVSINNKGNVPIYGVEIRKKGLGSVRSVKVFDDGTRTLAKGDGGEFEFDYDENNINVDDELIVIPIILGETETYQKSYVCNEDFGEIIEVK